MSSTSSMATTTSSNLSDDTSVQLLSAIKGFDHLFKNEVSPARVVFAEEDTPFHLLGAGVCAFLEAALSMEGDLLNEATRCLTLSEAGAKKKIKESKSKGSSASRFAPGLEWEVLHADVVVLLGLTRALEESYMGYLQCIYALNSSHSKFTKLYKTVFPNGLDNYRTPASSPAPSRKSSNPDIKATSSAISRSSLFGRWTTSSSLQPVQPERIPTSMAPEGPIEEMIVAGAAFGYGLFNLIFSLLPRKIQSVVGFFGFTHNRKLALTALAVAATKKDVHSTFAGLVLMTYYGVVMLLSGYQADEAHIAKQYTAIVDSIAPRYPTGALWILNRAKLLRMTYEPDAAIEVLQTGLKAEAIHSFPQADALLLFELAWTLMQQRHYQEAADAFLRMIQLSGWSHSTYYFIAAGCYICMKQYDKAQELLNKIPKLLNGKKIGGKDLPTEVLIKKKLEFYRQKQRRRGGNEDRFVEAIQISPADEIGICKYLHDILTFWNTHARTTKNVIGPLVEEWTRLSPAITPSTVSAVCPSADNDLDTQDELALRSLLVGIGHRTAGNYTLSRTFLTDAHQRHPSIQVSTWIGGLAMFELAVLDCAEREYMAKMADANAAPWKEILDKAEKNLDTALSLATSSVDLSSRLDSRIAMLRDEIATKREMLGMA